MVAWTGHNDRAIPGNPGCREAARERYFGGEPTGDPDACEMGEHLDIEGGICLLCGEWVLDYGC